VVSRWPTATLCGRPIAGPIARRRDRGRPYAADVTDEGLALPPTILAVWGSAGVLVLTQTATPAMPCGSWATDRVVGNPPPPPLPPPPPPPLSS